MRRTGRAKKGREFEKNQTNKILSKAVIYPIRTEWAVLLEFAPKKKGFFLLLRGLPGIERYYKARRLLDTTLGQMRPLAQRVGSVSYCSVDANSGY